MAAISLEGQQAILDMRELGRAERAGTKVWLRHHANAVRVDLGLPKREYHVEAFQQLAKADSVAVRRIYQAIAPAMKKLANDEGFMRYVIREAQTRNDTALELWAMKNLTRILQEKQL